MVLAQMFPASGHASVRVFLLGGQSNMVGQGATGELTPPLNAPQTDVNFWSGGWVPLAPIYGRSSTQFGPEVSFGRDVKDALPGDDIYLIKYGANGTSLYEDWAPTSGPQYNQFMNTANAALANLDAAGVDYEISGMIWMQGESDAAEKQSASYEANLRNFIAHMRSQFSTPEMPFVIARVLDHYGGQSGHAAVVRQAQIDVADATEYCSWFDTDGYQVVDPSSNPGHYGTQGQIDLGNDFAEGILTFVPESSSLTLLGIALLGAVLWRRRSRTSQ